MGTVIDGFTIDPDALLLDVRDAIYGRNSNRLKLTDVTALQIFDNESSFDNWNKDGTTEPLSPGTQIGSFGMSDKSPIIVAVPLDHYMYGIMRNVKTLAPTNRTLFSPRLVDRFNHSCRWEGDFFEISQEIACYVFRVTDRIVLHRRRAVDELYNDLEHLKRSVVIGPPGSGKSTCMFAKALSRAASVYTEAAILWINAERKQFFIIGTSWIEYYRIGPGSSWNELMEKIRAGEDNRFREIYVDQCRLNHQSEWIHNRRYYQTETMDFGRVSCSFKQCACARKVC